MSETIIATELVEETGRTVADAKRFATRSDRVFVYYKRESSHREALACFMMWRDDFLRMLRTSGNPDDELMACRLYQPSRTSDRLHLQVG
jgi:hypothetical protein